MKIRPMNSEDRDTVLSMAEALYGGGAVDHPIPPGNIQQSFSDAVGGSPLLRGYLLEEDGRAAGYAYVTFCYSCEAAGEVVLLEELFVKEEYRGKGLGQQFLTWLFEAFPHAVRFRLEVVRGSRAAHLYLRSGFRFISYGQMIREAL